MYGYEENSGVFYLSSLLVVLVFGVIVRNAELFLRGPLRRWFDPGHLQEKLHQLQSITGEGAFLIRTFFFLLFGFSISLAGILNGPLPLQGVGVVAVLTLIRYLYLRYLARTSLVPEVFISPEGLITVLLFYSIPPRHLIGEVSENIQFVVILLTGILMLIGLPLTGKEKQAATGEY